MRKIIKNRNEKKNGKAITGRQVGGRDATAFLYGSKSDFENKKSLNSKH